MFGGCGRLHGITADGGGGFSFHGLFSKGFFAFGAKAAFVFGNGCRVGIPITGGTFIIFFRSGGVISMGCIIRG